MNEEQLADLLAQHLDTLLEGGALPEDLPAEVAELLSVAQNLAEAAPAPRPEFGPLLQESLLGPAGGGNGAPPAPGSALNGHTISMVVVGLLAGAAILAVLLSIFVYGVARSNLSESSPTPAPAQTQTTPAPALLTPTTAPAVTAQATLETPTTPTVTATPVLDILPPITVTVEIIIEPPDLVPGSGGGGDGGDSGGGGGSSGDHDRGHGNDPDHNDEDNPGRGGGDD